MSDTKNRSLIRINTQKLIGVSILATLAFSGIVFGLDRVVEIPKSENKKVEVTANWKTSKFNF
ncbi:MAG: hypothetical protein HC847_19995 [Hydrococcus sp. RU_2_2]|nr:hypothetical protein [Hydrococcus sp. RU_2_2]